MVLRYRSWLAAASLLTAFQTAWAEAPIGYVKNVRGTATVLTAGKSLQAEPGTQIFQGSQIRTGAGASLGVTFKDNTVMSFGPDTDLTVDDYLYNPNQGQIKFASRLAKGTLNYVSGAIARIKPESVEVRTPAGIIGVRGTQFLAKVEE